MSSIHVAPLREDLSFGARVTGVTLGVLEDPSVREQLRQVFDDRGMILFEDVEPDGALQVEISTVFGPLKDHPVPTVPRAGGALHPGVIEIGQQAFGQWLVILGQGPHGVLGFGLEAAETRLGGGKLGTSLRLRRCDSAVWAAIEQHQVSTRAIEDGQGGEPVRDDLGLVAFALQQERERLGERRLVLDDQDAGHGVLSSCVTPS